MKEIINEKRKIQKILKMRKNQDQQWEKNVDLYSKNDKCLQKFDIACLFVKFKLQTTLSLGLLKINILLNKFNAI